MLLEEPIDYVVLIFNQGSGIVTADWQFTVDVIVNFS